MSETLQEQNKALVLKAFNLLFNERDLIAAKPFWAPDYIQHSSKVRQGRDGLFELVASLPAGSKYEPAEVMADGDLVMLRGRFSFGQPANWIAADVVRVKDGLLVEHWDVIQDEARQEQSLSGLPMFGAEFPA